MPAKRIDLLADDVSVEISCMHKFLKYWFPVLLVMAIIFRASCVPGKDIPPLFPYEDVVYHFFIYLFLAFFFARALKNTYPALPLRRVILFTIIFGILYASSDEYHQLFVPGRSGISKFDLLIDDIGSAFGSLVYSFLLPLVFRYRKCPA